MLRSAALLAAALLAACGSSEPPAAAATSGAEKPAADTATEATPSSVGGLQGTELRDAIQQPLDKARDVEAMLQQDAANTAAQIEAAEREANGESTGDEVQN